MIFDELVRRDLIDLPDSCIVESIDFHHPDDLEMIFMKQEESNLSCIQRLQEIDIEEEQKKLDFVNMTQGTKKLVLED